MLCAPCAPRKSRGWRCVRKLNGARDLPILSNSSSTHTQYSLPVQTPSYRSRVLRISFRVPKRCSCFYSMPIYTNLTGERAHSESSSNWEVSSCSLTAILANAGPKVPMSLSLVLILRLFLRALSCTIPGNNLGELADMWPTASCACSDGDIM